MICLQGKVKLAANSSRDNNSSQLLDAPETKISFPTRTTLQQLLVWHLNTHTQSIQQVRVFLEPVGGGLFVAGFISWGHVGVLDVLIIIINKLFVGMLVVYI